MATETSYPCPCGGRLKSKKDTITWQRIDCGILEVIYCENCGEEYLPEQSMRIVEAKLKKKAEMAEIDYELVEKIRRSLEDVKHGRISEWKPKQVKVT